MAFRCTARAVLRHQQTRRSLHHRLRRNRSPSQRSRRKVSRQLSLNRLQRVNQGVFHAVAMLLAYFGFMAAQAVWIYFYVDTSVHPIPPKFINSTKARWSAYVAFMYVFGALLSFFNFFLWGSIAMVAVCRCEFRENFGKFGNVLFCIVILPIAWWMFVYPAFGAKIILPPVQRRAFFHDCDSWAAQVVLDARGYRDPGSVVNTAIFTTSRDNSPLFSFDLVQNDSSFANFHFRKFDASESTLNSSLVPVVRSISYDFVKHSVNGTCVTPDGSNDTCLNGSFNLVNFSLDLNYTLPGRSHLESRSKSEQSNWKVGDGLPPQDCRPG
ncbi:hypothetical protein BKA62DRAFT_128297 [Auriculariales sp. MPI-PUGE-AT-0066]|nr:hypothetical protein BKA62DRAFT_128297 [Auriculariales sp. MPI-PUGE-AT-0066]